MSREQSQESYEAEVAKLATIRAELNAVLDGKLAELADDAEDPEVREAANRSWAKLREVIAKVAV